MAISTGAHLGGLASGWAKAFAAAVQALVEDGVEVVPVDIAPLLDAAVLLYERAFVA